MNRFHVYLMGQISIKKEQTYLWRENFRKEFEEDDRFNIIDPCNNQFNQSLLKEAKNPQNADYTHDTIKNALQKKGVDIIVPKDRFYVHISDIGIANLNMYDLISR